MRRVHSLQWVRTALRDLGEIREYVSRDNPAAAADLAERIQRRVESLMLHPLAGRIVLEFPSRGYREVIVYPYRIVYVVRSLSVSIVRVWHGRRDLKREDLPEEK
ncbi:MAG: type II toxin-antitoxin system RelE/ParE family toxin [Planctomycetota bacterium]